MIRNEKCLFDMEWTILTIQQIQTYAAKTVNMKP